MAADILVLLNPAAGTLERSPEVVQELTDHDGLRDAEIRLLPGPENLREAAEAAVLEGRKVVVAGGGDGTIHQVAGALLPAMAGGDDGPTLAVLPLGTANDLARSLGVGKLDDALDALAAARSARIDVLRVDLGEGPELGLNVGVAGFAGEVQKELTPDMKKRWGVLSYVRGGIEAYDGNAYDVTLALDGGAPESMSLLTLVLANGRYCGGGLPVAPGALLDDGLMEVVTFEGMELKQLATLAPRVLTGRHEQHDGVATRRAQRLRITSPAPLHFSIDGEPSYSRDALVEVEARRLRVLVGHEAAVRGQGTERAGPGSDADAAARQPVGAAAAEARGSRTAARK